MKSSFLFHFNVQTYFSIIVRCFGVLILLQTEYREHVKQHKCETPLSGTKSCFMLGATVEKTLFTIFDLTLECTL